MARGAPAQELKGRLLSSGVPTMPPEPPSVRAPAVDMLAKVGVAVAALAAAAQLGLLLYAFARRLLFPFDLEWLEGGMLCHALRLMEGESLYGPPSADFIALLYTPLYPIVLAGLGKLVGLSYGLARAISLASFVGVLALVFRTVRREAGGGGQAALWALVPLGLIASAFPLTAGWYDLARCDSLYLLLITLALVLLRYRGQELSMLIAAGVLAGLAFLTKQTASPFIVMTGGYVLLTQWRRLPIYVGAVAMVAGGGSLLLNRQSDGWYWRYVFEMHQGHPFAWSYFWPKSELILLRHFPIASALCGACVVALVARVRRQRRLSADDHSSLYWLAVALTGLVTAATGYATQWAAKNALIPGVVFPALFLGVALPRVMAWRPAAPGADWQQRLGPWVCLALGLQLTLTLYDPARLVPTAAAERAGQRLLALIRSFAGPVLIPSHPYYAVLAGKRPNYQAMGIPDVTAAGYPFPEDLRARLASGYYDALVFDFVPGPPYPARQLLSGQSYRLSRELDEAEAPRALSGARVRPKFLYVRAAPRQATTAQRTPAP